MPADVVLEVCDLHAGYGRAQVLDGVNFRVHAGTTVAIVGANGAGKTTLLRTISGLHRGRSGTISALGRRIDTLAPDRISRLGIAHVPEGRQVFGPMSVQDNLLVGAHLHRSTEAGDLERMYALFPILRDKRREPAATLSGGQQQMLAVARGLMSRPRLLLMDEPSMGLSPKLVGEVADIIREISSAGTTVVLVEQNAEMALSVAEHAFVLELGRVALEGPAATLAGDPRVRELYLGG